MTREEVKAQLAKCPLEWEETIYPDEIVSTLDISGSVKLQYTIAGTSLGVRGISYDRSIFGTCLYHGEEDPKAKAEAHRLDLICRLLGIND